MFNIFGGKKKDTLEFTFRALIYEAEGEWVAHCLDLDLVTTAGTSAQAEKDIIDLIICQVDFAFRNDNMENLFQPAPAEAWAMLGKVKSCEKKEVKKQDHSHIGGVELCHMGGGELCVV